MDTKAEPPRAIWTHPYEDEQYLKEHPEVREKVGSLAQQRDAKDSSNSKPARRHSFNGNDSASMVPAGQPTMPDYSKKGKERRGFFGKLKDKAIGTKEEREAYRLEQARVSPVDSAFLQKFFDRSTTPRSRPRDRSSVQR